MLVVYITCGVIVLLFIIVMIIVPEIKYNKAKKVLKEYSGFKEYKKEVYDITLENDDTILYIKLLDAPKNSMITINAKDTWVLSYGGSSSDLGKAYPNKKYVDEIKKFLKTEFTNSKKVEKIILINPSTNKIVRYLNETELDVVTDKNIVYGYRIFMMSKINEELEMLDIRKNSKQ